MDAQSLVSLGPVGSASYNANDKDNGTGQIHCIAFHPDYNTNNIMFAGTPYRGLWRSNDRGVNWINVPLVDATGQWLEVNSVNDIVLTKQGNNVTLYITTGSSTRYSATTPWVPSCGIYKSNNLGVTFKPVGTFNNFNGGYTFSKQKIVTKIAIHPNDTTKMFVACSDGLLRTTNAGASWTQVLTDGDESEPSFDNSGGALAYNSPLTPGIWSVAYSPSDTNVVYASGQHVYRSINAGASFTTLTNASFNTSLSALGNLTIQRNMNIKISKQGSTDIIYCTAFGKVTQNPCIPVPPATSCPVPTYYGIYRMEIGTGIWSTICDDNCWTIANAFHLPTDDRLKLDVRPNSSAEVVAGVTVTRRSTNNGSSWSYLTGYNVDAHADIHEIKYSPNGDEVFIGTDGGIFRCEIPAFGPITVAERNNGLSVSTILDMSVSTGYKGYIVSGKQDTNYDWFNGFNWFQDGETGDGYAPAWFDRTETNYFFFKRGNTQLNKRNILTNTVTSVATGCTGGELEYLYQNPLPVKGNWFYSIRHANRRLYITNSANHSENYDLLTTVTTPNIDDSYGIRQIVVSKKNNALYAVPREIGFWAYTDLMKFNLDNYVLTAIGGDCSTDIPCNGNCTEAIPYLSPCQSFYTASSVAFNSSDNANTLWVGLEYNDKYINHPKYVSSGCQVAHSGYRFRIRKRTIVNNLPNWTNDDAGLPQYPIRHLVYVDGSNDAMFCATANGRIFYKNANLTQWQEVNPNLPRSPISKLEINYCTKRLYVATFGRGIYYVDLNSIPAHTNQVLEIATNQTWNSNYYDIGGNIVIKSGNTLVINGTTNGTIVNMSKNSKIVIERNARLIVINATLTNSCGELWAGIEVLGDNTKVQTDIDFLESSPYNGFQGACVFRGGSTVEFMNYGIVMGRHIFTGSNSFNGGQIITDGSFFKNNKKSIAFSTYTPPVDLINPNPLGIYRSKLKDTEFDNNSVNLFKHVIVSGIRGLSIEGCTFKNSVSYSLQPYSNRGFGVHVLGGEVIVLTNAQSNLKNKFENLTYGIKIDVGGFSSGGNTIGTKVYDAIFTNNKFGMYMASGTFAKINANTFNVPGLDDCMPIVGGTAGDCKSYGLYLLASVGYKVQDNVFNATGGHLAIRKTYGILVNNAAANNEAIRRNTFNLFRYAMTAVGVNSNSPGLNGLQFLCNTLNQNRTFDLWVTEDATTTGSIRSGQGANCNGFPQNAANNVFIQGNVSTPSLQLARNQNTQSYTYWAVNNTSTYWPTRVQTNYMINRQSCNFLGNTNFPIVCPSQLDPTDFQPLMINQWNGQMAAMRSSIDGGNTLALKNELSDATPVDIADVYAELNQKEAISDEVLKNAIESPYAAYGLEELKELIIKNSGLDDTHIDALIAAQLPFTSSDVNDMEAAQNKLSPEDIIKAELADQESMINEYTMAWSEKYLERGETDSALLMLKLYETPSTLAQLANLSLRKGRYAEARAAAQRTNDQDLVDFIDVANEVSNHNKAWNEADETTKNSLWSIYAKGGRAGIYASSVLAEIADTALLPYLPDEDLFTGKKESEVENKWRLIKTVNSSDLKVSPNPASQQLQLSFTAKEAKRLTITVMDANSAVVYSTVMTNAKAEIDVSNWKTGLYLIKGADDLGQSYFKKFNVIH